MYKNDNVLFSLSTFVVRFRSREKKNLCLNKILETVHNWIFILYGLIDLCMKMCLNCYVWFIPTSSHHRKYVKKNSFHFLLFYMEQIFQYKTLYMSYAMLNKQNNLFSVLYRCYISNILSNFLFFLQNLHSFWYSFNTSFDS